MAFRPETLAERLRQVLSTALLFEFNDPKLQGITITRVKVSPDLHYADIRFIADPERERQALNALRRAAGAMRRHVSKKVKVKNTPELRFHIDEDVEAEARIGEILERLDIQKEANDPDA